MFLCICKNRALFYRIIPLHSLPGIEAGSEDMNHILTATKEGHFQKACSLQFSAAHRGQELSTGIVNHPNQFYMESVNGGVAGGSAPSSQAKHQTHKAHLYLEKPKTQDTQESSSTEAAES